MKRIMLWAIVAAVSSTPLSVAPIGGAVEAQAKPVACYRILGVGHHYALVRVPCAVRRSPVYPARTAHLVPPARRVTF